MNRPFRLAVAAGLIGCSTTYVSADTNWPQFRGASGNNIAADQSVPIRFGEKENVTWKTEIPGRAWSSPVVADGTIWATTAIERVPTEEERVAMLAEAGIEQKKFKSLAIAKSIDLKLVRINFKTGKLEQTIDLVEVNAPDQIHALNSYASPTPAIDGPRIYCHFGTYGTFCLDRDSGETLWTRTLPLEHGVGPGSSPLIHQDKIVLIQDGVDRQYVIALNKMTGKPLGNGSSRNGCSEWRPEKGVLHANDGCRQERSPAADLHGIAMDGCLRPEYWKRAMEGRSR